MAIGPLNIDVPSIPQLDVGDYVPDAIRPARQQSLQPNQPRAASAAQTKYSAGGYFDKLIASGTYAPHAINALRNYDQDRIARGQSPLSEKETTAALQAATTKEQVTPEAKRSLFNLPGNIVRDASAILKSIPRLPGALIDEVQSLPTIGQHIAEADNPLVGLASAPGIRMLPGAFIAEQIAGGTPGELLRHPLFTGLDVLPLASTAAKSTKVAKAADTIAKEFSSAGTVGGVLAPEGSALFRQGLESQRLARRPLKTALTRTLDDEGNIIRNTAGEMANVIGQTKLGQAYAGVFGQQSRDAVFITNSTAGRINRIMEGSLSVPDDALAALAPKAVEYQKWLDENGLNERAPELHDALTRGGSTGDALIDEAVERTREFKALEAEALQQSQQAVMFDNELYDLKKGLQLKEAERGIVRQREFTEHRGTIEAGTFDPTIIQPSQVVSNMLENFRRPRRDPNVPPPTRMERLAGVEQISKNDLTLQHNIMLRKLRAAGFDTRELSEAWQSVEGRFGKRRKDGTISGRVVKDPQVYEDLLKELAVDQSRLPALKMLPVEEAVTKLKSLTRDKSAVVAAGVKDVLFGIENRNWNSITKGLEQLRRTDVWNDEALITRLREMRDSGKFIDKHLAKFTDKSLAKRNKDFTQLTAEAVPARFLPEVDRIHRAKLKEKLIPVGDAAAAQKVIELADTGMWAEIPGFTDKMYRQVQREAATSWQALRDQGFDPVFVHTVTPNKANSALHAYATVVPKTASSVKARAWDMAPTVKNVALSVNHQLMELISKNQVELGIKQIMDRMGETEMSLRQRFAPAAQARAANMPALDFEGHLMKLIGEQYKKFDPDVEGYAWGSPYLKKLKQDAMWIPNPVAKNLKLLAEPKRLLGGILDPITNAFRIATTSLSLRTQVYNIFGNGIASELQNPGILMRSTRKAQEYMRDPTKIPEPLMQMIGSTKQGQLDLTREAMGATHSSAYHYLRGKTLGRLLKEDSKLGGKVKQGFKTATEASFALNSKFDDFYRMVNYIDEYDRAIKVGSNAADAERKAITAVRNNIQDWMSATPIERSVIRSIIPFYGYMGHAMRFVLRYPFDHPLRTEMITKLAKTEMEDEALPDRFLSMLFMGGIGEHGEQNALNAGPFNPFGDIANYMTIQGVLGGTNPVIQTILKTVGVDSGQQELYPSLRYNTETGRLSAAGTNPLTNMLHNTLPQSQVITALLGINEEYKDMARRDPAAANRYLASGLTIPIAWRQINVDQELFKAEIARQDAQAKVKAEALKTGDWSEALRYPSLREYLEAIESLPDEQRQAYTKLSPDQIAALTSSEQAQIPLPQFKGIEPLDTTVDTLLKANQQGVILPGSSTQNTTGGI